MTEIETNARAEVLERHARSLCRLAAGQSSVMELIKEEGAYEPWQLQVRTRMHGAVLFETTKMYMPEYVLQHGLAWAIGQFGRAGLDVHTPEMLMQIQEDLLAAARALDSLDRYSAGVMIVAASLVGKAVSLVRARHADTATVGSKLAMLSFALEQIGTLVLSS